jgi:mono/diheme cytochrome c family protein
VIFPNRNFSSSQTVLYSTKTSEGRKDMPAFKKKIPDAEELWSVVNYLRTLKIAMF